MAIDDGTGRCRLALGASHQPLANSPRDDFQPSLQEPPLRLLARERERALERRARVGRSSEPPAQLGAGGVREAIVAKFASTEDRVDEREACGRAVADRDR